MSLPAHVAVGGAGFGGRSAIRELRRRDRAVRIMPVAPHPELHYLPGVIWITSGPRRREALVVPPEGLLRESDVRLHAAEATGRSTNGRALRTTQAEVANDALVAASGGRF